MNTLTEQTTIIPLTQGVCAIIDKGLEELVNQWSWHTHWNKTKHGLVPYGRRTVGRDPETGKWKHQTLHGFIYRSVHGEVPKGLVVDHKSQNTLDNTIGNLRTATIGANGANQKQRREGIPQGVWVRKQKKFTNYSARIRFNGKDIYLGSFLSMEEAARRAAEARHHYFGV